MSGQIVDLAITDVVYRGKGIARSGGRVIFVPGVIAGESVKAEITKDHKNFSDARLVEIRNASPMRMRPKCPLALCPAGVPGSIPLPCAGCCYQHMRYEEEVRIKQSQLVNMLERMAKIGASVCLPPVPSPSELNYRNKIVLHGGIAGDKPVLGYFGDDNASVVEIPECHLAMPALNELLSSLRSKEGFISSLKPGARVTLRHTPHDGAVSWVGKCSGGDTWLVEEVPLAGVVRVPRDSFFQVNPAVANVLLEKVVDLIKRYLPEVFVDLYCGVGVFALAAARAGVARVMGIDSDSLAISAAKHNAEANQFQAISFGTNIAAKGLKGLSREISGAKTVILVDPPRRGLEEIETGLIGSLRPAAIIYVSCAPDTMARDVGKLREGGYVVTETTLIDMFPRTPYFESITCLEPG